MVARQHVRAHNIQYSREHGARARPAGGNGIGEREDTFVLHGGRRRTTPCNARTPTARQRAADFPQCREDEGARSTFSVFLEGKCA